MFKCENVLVFPHRETGKYYLAIVQFKTKKH